MHIQIRVCVCLCLCWAGGGGLFMHPQVAGIQGAWQQVQAKADTRTVRISDASPTHTRSTTHRHICHLGSMLKPALDAGKHRSLGKALWFGSRQKHAGLMGSKPCLLGLSKNHCREGTGGGQAWTRERGKHEAQDKPGTSVSIYPGGG